MTLRTTTSTQPRAGDPRGAVRVLEASHLNIVFTRRDGSAVPVVRDVSLTLGAAEVIGIVGESGSGKTMTARALMGLSPRGSRVSGQVRLGDQDLLSLSERDLRRVRGAEIAMMFQDPMASFNPVRRIGDQIAEAITVHARPDPAALQRRVVELLGQVGILEPEARSRAYPHEFSGGMLQRALLAMAMANRPKVLIADEPTTALDVTVQDQILNLLRDQNKTTGTAIIVITHNLGVVANLCSRVVVMYAGCIVEDGPVAAVLGAPQHPYTWMLLRSVPRLTEDAQRLAAIDGQPPDPSDLPTGCKFHPRCPFAVARCRTEEPSLQPVAPLRSARCHFLMSNLQAEGVARD